ncbi:MAG: hypothetical protein QNK37_01310 [Acidobacteriota bacterium]|nr:hypothetical protein [Acidobacteriota bacterium]
MFLLIWLAWQGEPEPVGSVFLNRPAFGGQYVFTKYVLGGDGTFLINEGFYIYHYDRDGKLIRRFGGRGGGPGEFGARILESAYDGETYYVFDNTGNWNLFDRNGRFIRRGYRPVRGLHFVGQNLFGSQVSLGDYQNAQVPVVGMFYRNREDFPKTFTRFHPTAEANTRDLDFRFSLCFFLERNGILFAVNELETKLYLYDKDLTLQKKFDFQAPTWSDPPKKFFMNWRNAQAYARWWCSFPKIRGLTAMDDQLIIPMEIPDPDNPTEPALAVLKMGTDGKLTRPAFKAKALYLGVYRSQMHLLFIHDNDDAAFPDFEVRRYRW